VRCATTQFLRNNLSLGNICLAPACFVSAYCDLAKGAAFCQILLKPMMARALLPTLHSSSWSARASSHTSMITFPQNLRDFTRSKLTLSVRLFVVSRGRSQPKAHRPRNPDSEHMTTAHHLCVVMPDFSLKRIPVVLRIALDIVIVGRAVMIKAKCIHDPSLSPQDTQ
jgi:hypothetical protein